MFKDKSSPIHCSNNVAHLTTSQYSRYYHDLGKSTCGLIACLGLTHSCPALGILCPLDLQIHSPWLSFRRLASKYGITQAPWPSGSGWIPAIEITNKDLKPRKKRGSGISFVTPLPSSYNLEVAVVIHLRP